MSKAQLYAFTKQKLVLLAIAVLVSQASLFGAGYLMSTLLRPEPVMVAANGQPCSLPGLAASAAPSTAPASASPAAGASAQQPANAAAEVANAEKSATGAVASAAAQPAAAEAALQSAATRQVPPEFAAAAKLAPALATGPSANAAPAPASAPAAGTAAAPGTAAMATAAPQAASPAAVANPKVAAVACENVPDVMNADADASSEPHKYAVQIGAFLDPNNALRLASEFKAKGYQPCLMIASDRQGRRWTVVRMGSFNDVGQASTYARSITGREQTVALVRPADAF